MDETFPTFQITIQVSHSFTAIELPLELSGANDCRKNTLPPTSTFIVPPFTKSLTKVDSCVTSRWVGHLLLFSASLDSGHFFFFIGSVVVKVVSAGWSDQLPIADWGSSVSQACEWFSAWRSSVLNFQGTFKEAYRTERFVFRALSDGLP